MNDKFYVVLPSSSSIDVFPDNKISNFKVNLPNPLEIDVDKWEVALQEIHFNNSWYNIRENKNVIIKTYFNLTLSERKLIRNNFASTVKFGKKTSTGMELHRHIKIPKGCYKNVKDIVDLLNNQEKGDPKPTNYQLDESSQQTIISSELNCSLDMFNSDIAKILGFPPTLKLQGGIETSHNISRTNVHDNVYVYTDIVQNQHVGDYKVPLLRVVPVRSTFGQMNWVHYDQPHYLRLSRGNITTIEINIRDELGDFISFEGGKAIVTLVFRRKRIQLYS